MKILHTSDWHLGKRLFAKTRYEEFEAFLTWLLSEIKSRNIDVLLVAGDIFDTTTPSNKAQRLYYNFLKEVSETCCRHVVIIAGNHDSPSLLEAPRELLELFHVRVIASIPENLEEQVLLLNNNTGTCELIVCAVPYLRDRDIRSSQAGESADDKDRILLESIAGHYRDVTALAIQKRTEIKRDVPIIATGHLFAAGGKVIEGDGVRDLYVGSLAHVPAEIFDPQLDYLALGHLHSAQIVGNDPTRRYSGSPLPMSFKEALKEKHVIIIDISNNDVSTETVPIPRFQIMQSLKGNYEKLVADLQDLKSTGVPMWLEILYEGTEVIPNLQQMLQDIVENSPLKILRIVNVSLQFNSLNTDLTAADLGTMSEEEVFLKCLETSEINSDQQDNLLSLFRVTLQQLNEEDNRAE